MTLTMRDAHRHADRILEVVRSGVQPSRPTTPVAQSWSRCLNEYRLHPARPREPVVHRPRRAGGAPRAPRRRDRLRALRDDHAVPAARRRRVGGGADRHRRRDRAHGVVARVRRRGRPAGPARAAACGARPRPAPTAWAPAWPPAGRCRCAAKTTSSRQFTQLTCSAVPVYDPSGEIAAVLDVTSRSSLMQQHLLVLLGMTARMIENRLIDARFRNAHPLHFHSRPEFVYTLHEGKLAVGDDGRILAANRSALFQLGLQSMDEIRSRRIEDLFQTSLEDMLQRSTVVVVPPGGDLPRQCGAALLRGGAPAGVGRQGAARWRVPAAPRRRRRCARAGDGAGARCRQRAGRRPASTFKDPRLRRPPRHRAPRHRAPDAGAAVRRDRLGQGGVRARRARRQPACRRRLRRRQLRQPARDADRVRAVRLPRRRLHRRAAHRPARQDPAGRRRHAVPRRDRRHAAGAAGAPAARARRAPGHAAGHRRDASRSTSSSSAPATSTCRRWCAKGASAKTCTTGWPASSCSCRRCASAATSAS